VLTTAGLVQLLDKVPETQLNAVVLLSELVVLDRAGQLNATSLGLLHDDIEKAIDAMDRYVEDAKGMVRRCSQLPAIPSASVPPGF
jgi:hypothetical protein